MTNSNYLTGPYRKEQNYLNKKERAIFILCDTCYWSATYFTQFMLPADGRCPSCQNTELSSFPILLNESFVANYSESEGLELEFKFTNMMPDKFYCY
ncbi:MAG: hypothetical protein WA364_08115 [Candidatus Nitrosopolaris sp.]